MKPINRNPPPAPIVVDGTASVMIPLQVTVSLGVPEAEIGGVSGPIAARAEGMLRRPKAPPAAESLNQFTVSSLLETSFDWRVALSLALASSLSYESRATVEGTARNVWGLADCRFIEADETQCFAAWSADAALVAFRGTESLGDWLGNLNMTSTTRSYGAVHRGFLGAFQVVDAQLRNVLAGLGGRPVLLTGHSLGGALATIAAAEWQGQVPISMIYTYGQPATGKGAFPAFISKHYSNKFFRFVNDDDIVPRVPPTYRHTGRPFHFDADGNLQGRLESAARELAGAVFPPLAGSPAEPRMLTEAEFDLLRVQLLELRAQARASGLESLDAPMIEGIFPSVSDHSLDEYISKIAANV